MRIKTFILAGILLPLGAYGQHYHTIRAALNPNSSTLDFTTARYTNNDLAEELIAGTERSYAISFADRTMTDTKTKEVRNFTEAEALKFVQLIDYMPSLTQRLIREWCTYDASPAHVMEWLPWEDNGRINLYTDDLAKPAVIVRNGRGESKFGPEAECTKSGTKTPFAAEDSTDTRNLLVVSTIWTQYAAESAEWWDLGFGKEEQLKARAARLQW